MTNVVRHLARGAASLITGVAVLAAVVAGIGVWAGLRPQPVLSGSMEPGLPTGSLAVAHAVPASSVAVGDVITFARPNAPGETITHRVIAIGEQGGTRTYRTQGDANRVADPWTLRLAGQVGRHVATVPHAGHVATAAARPTVRAGTVILFCLLLLAATLRRIWARDERSGAIVAGPETAFAPRGPVLHAGCAGDPGPPR